MTTPSQLTAKIAILVTLLASSQAFAPSARIQPLQNVVLSASRNDENDGLKKVAGGAMAFVTGLGFMAQVALADPTLMASVDHGEFL